MWQIWWKFINYMTTIHECAVYIAIQLGRCALLSLIILPVVWVLRHMFFRKLVFLRGGIWSIFLMLPFMGKIRIFYENALLCRLFIWWNNGCITHWQLCYAYLLGVGISIVFLLRKNKKLHRMILHMEKRCVCGQEIYVNEMSVTPFTSGLVHSKTVIPRILLQNMQKEELQIILLHEKIHVRLGHLWLYLLWDVMRALLWLNPFFTVVTKNFREDMESICDALTMQEGGIEAGTYGMCLIKCIRLMRTGSAETAVTFAGEKAYADMKRRFQRIADIRLYKKISFSVLWISFAAVLALTGYWVKEFSYPVYTVFTDITIMNDAGKLWTIEDSEALRDAFYADGKNVHIDTGKMDDILRQHGIEEECFYLAFGGFMKIPGVGGGGCFVSVEYSGERSEIVIPYYNRDADPAVCIYKKL